MGTSEVIHRYSFRDEENGFTITGKDRAPCTVKLTNNRFVLNNSYAVIGLYEYHKLVDNIADTIYSTYKPPEEHLQSKGQWKVFKWSKRQCAKGLNKRIHERWLNLLNKADPKVREVQKRVFSCTGKYFDVTTNPKFYEHPYFSNDVLNYRAAAMSVSFIELPEYAPNQVRPKSSSQKSFLDTWEFRELKSREDGLIYDWSNWMGFYSHDGKAYGALQKTLMNLPGRIPPHLLRSLRRLKLTRPIYDRIELISLLSYAECAFYESTFEHIFMNATRKQLVTALKKLARWRHTKINLGKYKHIRTQIQLIADYPHTHNGNVVGLAEKSIEWHKNTAEREAEKLKSRRATLTTKPPIDLPKHEAITFLDTVGAIIDEGLLMHHCISSYADYAVRGGSYLFHINYKGELASVQVNPNGHVVQSHGPNNRVNGASEWGRKYLSKWGSALREVSAVNTEDDCPF